MARYGGLTHTHGRGVWGAVGVWGIGWYRAGEEKIVERAAWLIVDLVYFRQMHRPMIFGDHTEARLLLALKKAGAYWELAKSVYFFLEEKDEQEEMAKWLEEKRSRNSDEIWNKIGKIIGAI